MKLRKIILTCLNLILILQICLGQERKAELFDKFVPEGNDPLQVRINLFYESVNNTNSKGYIIVYGTQNDKIGKYLYERHIKGCFRWGNLSTKNFVFALGEDKSKFEIELWQVPNGADKPQFSEGARDYKVPKLNKPRLLHMLSFDDSYCPLGFGMELYSNFLKPNPNLIGQIIIREKNLKFYQKVKRKYFDELTKAYKVSPLQIRFVKGKYNGEPDVEFWLVQKNRK